MVALLIDGESLDASLGPQIVDWADIRGRVRFAHVFGDFHNTSHAAWCDQSLELNLQLELTRSPTPHKNTADIALTIKAMDLLHDAGVREFCIAAHDRDYIPLARRLREAGARVYFVGRQVDNFMRLASDRWKSLGATEPRVAPSVPALANKGLGRLVERFRGAAEPNGALHLSVAAKLLRDTCPDLVVGKPKTNAARRAYEETKLFDIIGAGNDIQVRLRTIPLATQTA